jgi:hypothetical protein
VFTIESFDAHLEEEGVVGVTCRQLQTHLFEALALPTFSYGVEIFYFFEGGMGC